jgi:hypothetical protein
VPDSSQALHAAAAIAEALAGEDTTSALAMTGARPRRLVLTTTHVVERRAGCYTLVRAQPLACVSALVRFVEVCAVPRVRMLGRVAGEAGHVTGDIGWCSPEAFWLLRLEVLMMCLSLPALNIDKSSASARATPLVHPQRSLLPSCAALIRIQLACLTVCSGLQFCARLPNHDLVGVLALPTHTSLCGRQ